MQYLAEKSTGNSIEKDEGEQSLSSIEKTLYFLLCPIAHAIAFGKRTATTIKNKTKKKENSVKVQPSQEGQPLKVTKERFFLDLRQVRRFGLTENKLRQNTLRQNVLPEETLFERVFGSLFDGQLIDRQTSQDGDRHQTLQRNDRQFPDRQLKDIQALEPDDSTKDSKVFDRQKLYFDIKSATKTIFKKLYPLRHALTTFGLATIIYISAVTFPTNTALVAFIGDQEIGAVESVRSVELAKLYAQEEITQKYGYEYRFLNEVKYDIKRGSKKPLNHKALMQFFDDLTKCELTQSSGLYVDGVLTAVASDRELIDSLLNEAVIEFGQFAQQTDSGRDAQEFTFANRITVINGVYPKCSILDETQLRTLLKLPQKQLPKVSNIVQNLSLNVTGRQRMLNKYLYQFSEPFLVTPALKLSAREMSETIEAYNSNVFLPEEEITLNYSVVKYETLTEPIKYHTEYQDCDELLVGQTEIIQRGVDGTKQVTYKVEYIEGNEVSRTLKEQNPIKLSVPMIIRQGTRIPTAEELAVMPTGTYILPYEGKLSSGYGWRTLFGFKDFHPAWDICGALDSCVVAIDGGTVIFTGNGGGYGNYVMIDHGDELVSLYAHLNSITVSIGDKIGQGGEVGKMGSTGRATGVHVHLEIRKNNIAQDPSNYLDSPPYA